MARCKKCDARIESESKFCPECGERQKREHDDQRHAGADRKHVKNLQERIEYLKELLDDNEIEYEKADEEED